MSEPVAAKDLEPVRLHTMLSPRTANLLGRQGIDALADLMNYTRADLQSLPSFGAGTIAEIDAALAAHGLRLDGREPDQPTLVEEFATVLEQRDQLLALIGRITDAVSTAVALQDIDATIGGMDLAPTMRQIAATHRRDDR